MKPRNLLLLLVAFLSQLYTQGQNASIVYSSSNLANITNCPTCCNVFNQSASNSTVGNLRHWPVSGGAIFDGTNVIMATQVNAQQNLNTGTAYAIQYNFKVGYNYNVSFDLGYTATPSTAVPTITISLRTVLPDPNDTDPTSCGPVNNSKWSSSIGTPIIGIISPTQTGIKNYPLSAFSVQSTRSYLIITVSDGGVNVSNALINKITLNETSASPSFTLSPTSVTKTCGASLSQTFTTNSSNMPAGATISYIWNLGSANNNWMFNGSPAPQTITTTANTLSLTALDCAIAPVNNIVVTAVVNGTNYNAGTVTVRAAPFSIAGPGIVCSSGNTTDYSITNLGCTPTVSWTASPGGIVTINSPNSPTTTLSYLSDGGVTLIATYSGACGSGSLSIPVTSGSPVPTGASYFNSNYGYSSSSSIVSQYAILGADHGRPGDNDVAFNYTINDTRFTSYTWTPISQPSGTSYQIVDNGKTMWAYVTNPYTNRSVTITMQLQAFGGPCGTYTQNVSSTAARISGWGRSSVSVYPNPAKDFVDVTSMIEKLSKSPSSQKIYAVKITDSYGVVRQSVEYKTGVSSLRISISKFRSGLYLLSTYDGHSWVNQQLIIQR